MYNLKIKGKMYYILYKKLEILKINKRLIIYFLNCIVAI